MHTEKGDLYSKSTDIKFRNKKSKFNAENDNYSVNSIKEIINYTDLS